MSSCFDADTFRKGHVEILKYFDLNIANYFSIIVFKYATLSRRKGYRNSLFLIYILVYLAFVVVFRVHIY